VRPAQRPEIAGRRGRRRAVGDSGRRRKTSNSEGERDSEHGEPAAEANAQSDTKKKKGRASKSAIGKTAKQPPAKESPTRTRVAGKRTIVAPDIYNPEKLSEKHAEARQLATKGRKVQAKKRASKS
jgi:hypothetical protein